MPHEQRVSREIGKSSLARYAGLGLPLAFAGLPIYMLAPDFYAVQHEVALATIGVGLLLLRVIDAFLDPLLGRLIDVLVERAAYISTVAAALLAVGFLMLFSPPNLSANYLVIWFFLSIFVVTLGFSAMAIIYGTVGALWSSDRKKQTLITGTREAVTLVGLILSISIPYILLEIMLPALAYLTLVGLFLLLLVGAFWTYLPLQSVILDSNPVPEQTMRADTSDPRDYDRSNLSPSFLYGTCALSGIASAVPGVLVIFFVRDYLGSQNFVALALVVYFLSGAISMPLWHKLANRVGKVRAWQCAMLLAIFSFSWVCLLSPGDYFAYAIICFASGAALGAEMALPPAILSEYFGENSRKSAALKYSGLTMISKIALAVAAGICLPLLGYFGFTPDQENTQRALLALLVLYGAVPGLLKLFALGLAQIWISKERSDYAVIENYSTTRSLRDV